MEQMSLLNQYDIDKDQFVELFSKFTGLSKTKIYKFLEDNSISTLFEHPTSINATESQIKKIDQLKEMRNLLLVPFLIIVIESLQPRLYRLEQLMRLQSFQEKY